MTTAGRSVRLVLDSLASIRVSWCRWRAFVRTARGDCSPSGSRSIMAVFNGRPVRP